MKNLITILSLFLIVFLITAPSIYAQEGKINDDFSTGNANNWRTPTAGATGQIVNGQFVVKMALQSSGKYRGDFQKSGGATLHAGNFPIVAIKFNKPPRGAMFFDTNLGAYRNASNNHTVIATQTGNIYYWDLKAGPLGTTTLSTTNPTILSLFQFKIADVVLTQAEIAANDTNYEVDWVKTFSSVEQLRTEAGIANPPVFEFTGEFNHPGLLHNTSDLSRIKNYVDQKFGRPYESYKLLLATSRASASYNKFGPYQYLTRDNSLTVNGVPGGTVKDGVENDFMAAYYNALMWNITGNEAHALKAIEIIDAYAATTQGIIGADAELNGLYGFMLTNAAELIRHTYNGWPQEKVTQCQNMLQSVFYPVLQNFRPCAHGNWDIICMKALMSIAIFSNDKPMFNKVVNYFYHGEGNGSIDNYVKTEAGQLQESNRDQPHTMLALGSLAEIGEIGLKQGIDLYQASNNAIMRGYEYTSKYNLGMSVPYETSYDYCERNYQDYNPEAISSNGRGLFRAVFEIAYNHYAYRKGLSMPYTLEVLEAMGPEGAPFGADNPGYGSLLFYLNTEKDHPFDTTNNQVDPTLGLIDDNFMNGQDGWIAATGGSTASVANGKLTITLVKQSNGKSRGDLKKSAGATIFPRNYPIFAIKLNKPAQGNFTFDTNFGAYGNGGNKWTGKVADDIYYYDLRITGFGAGPMFLSNVIPTTLPTFQFKVADITSAETSYSVEWIKTYHSLDELLSQNPHVYQTIAFNQISKKVLGDVDFAPGASASSGLPVTYSSSDTTVAKIIDNKIHILKAGIVEIKATQNGDSLYLPAPSVSQVLEIVPLRLAIQHKDGDTNQVVNNTVKPFLQLANNDSVDINLDELTIRYWLTPENYAGINAWIDYAEIGNEKVSIQYSELPSPRSGAFGFIEYKFSSTSGVLSSGTVSGVIQSRIGNKDWSVFNESNDYSYAYNSVYSENEKITLYRNGILIWGIEPLEVASSTVIKVSSENKNSNPNTNTLKTYLKISNEGNKAIEYGDLKVRYWFTAEGSSTLNYWIDYAKVGNTNVTGSFVAVGPYVDADQYFELSFSPSLGKLYPLSNSGNVQYRVSKANWSLFNELNDFSYKPTGSFSENNHITIYYKDQLIYGIEPVNQASARIASSESSSKSEVLSIYPNPVFSELHVDIPARMTNQSTIKIYNSKGELILVKNSQGGIEVINLQSIQEGIYLLELANDKEVITQKFIKQ